MTFANIAILLTGLIVGGIVVAWLCLEEKRVDLATVLTLLFFAGIAFVFGGCATTAPPPPTSTTDWQGMANQATYALKGWPVTVQTKPGTMGDYYCKGGRIELGTEGNTRWLLAHEIGHHLMGHCDERFQAEIEANAMAVKVMQVWGDSEEKAVLTTERHLLRLCVVRKNNPRPGHSYYGEFQDMVKRFPQYAAPDTAACLAP
jgi:hypothetical protein